MSKNIYIVLHDFSEAGDRALKYSIDISRHLENEIILLHIVDKESGKEAATQKLQAIIDKTEAANNTTLSVLAEAGNLFDDIGRIVEAQKAQLLIMGTHGAKGLQKVFGSFAMKVITNTSVPFFVIQKDTELKDIKKIVVPIDLTKESLQIINVAGDMAKMYDAEINVIAEKQSDPIMLQQMKNRILIVKNQYDDRKIKCNIEFINDGGSYGKKVIQYAKDKGMDMIAIAHHSESLIPSLDKFAQQLITNDLKLPCMIINSKNASSHYF
jgi:nucleotide-binding universal stress UspA family protein